MQNCSSINGFLGGIRPHGRFGSGGALVMGQTREYFWGPIGKKKKTFSRFICYKVLDIRWPLAGGVWYELWQQRVWKRQADDVTQARRSRHVLAYMSTGLGVDPCICMTLLTNLCHGVCLHPSWGSVNRSSCAWPTRYIRSQWQTPPLSSFPRRAFLYSAHSPRVTHPRKNIFHCQSKITLNFVWVMTIIPTIVIVLDSIIITNFKVTMWKFLLLCYQNRSFYAHTIECSEIFVSVWNFFL